MGWHSQRANTAIPAHPAIRVRDVLSAASGAGVVDACEVLLCCSALPSRSAVLIGASPFVGSDDVRVLESLPGREVRPDHNFSSARGKRLASRLPVERSEDLPRRLSTITETRNTALCPALRPRHHWQLTQGRPPSSGG